MVREQIIKDQIRLDGGWLVDIERDGKISYSIKCILALFGHGVYLPIDTRDLTEEQWQMFHERVKAQLEGW